MWFFVCYINWLFYNVKIGDLVYEFVFYLENKLLNVIIVDERINYFIEILVCGFERIKENRG